MDSRHLGVITLTGGVGGGWADSTVELAGSSVPFRLEIDFPGRFNELVVRNIDLALDSLPSIEELARDTIAGAVRRAGSAPAQLFDFWGSNEGNDENDAAEFLRQLRPTHITLLPDGGPDSVDRIVMTYGMPTSATTDTITVRFRESIGPELDPARRT